MSYHQHEDGDANAQYGNGRWTTGRAFDYPTFAPITVNALSLRLTSILPRLQMITSFNISLSSNLLPLHQPVCVIGLVNLRPIFSYFALKIVV